MYSNSEKYTTMMNFNKSHFVKGIIKYKLTNNNIKTLGYYL
jgi:hypothetical protein